MISPFFPLLLLLFLLVHSAAFSSYSKPPLIHCHRRLPPLSASRYVLLYLPPLSAKFSPPLFTSLSWICFFLLCKQRFPILHFFSPRVFPFSNSSSSSTCPSSHVSSRGNLSVLSSLVLFYPSLNSSILYELCSSLSFSSSLSHSLSSSFHFFQTHLSSFHRFQQLTLTIILQTFPIISIPYCPLYHFPIKGFKNKKSISFSSFLLSIHHFSSPPAFPFSLLAIRPSNAFS